MFHIGLLTLDHIVLFLETNLDRSQFLIELFQLDTKISHEVHFISSYPRI